MGQLQIDKLIKKLQRMCKYGLDRL